MASDATTAHGLTATRRYLIIWGWLAGLMLLGVLVSEVPLLPISRAALVAFVVLLSAVKAALVALYYMHLKGDARLLALIAAAPLALLLLVLGLVASSTLVRF